ncbi:MAG TPA: hypothetical protein VI356_11810 [Myxococcales bacterium]
MCAICAAAAQPASADPKPLLYGTTGACNNAVPFGPCTQQSTLVEIDVGSGDLIRVIGPVGFTVNGLAWDRTTQTLYGTTAVGDVTFHGLIVINVDTGAGTPVNPAVFNFGLSADPRESPIHSITVDFNGNMVGWYDEFPPPAGVTDTFVRIDKTTGIATEFPDTGINTANNGLSFQPFGAADILWNIDTPRVSADGTTQTQTAYVIDRMTGKPLSTQLLIPPTPAALGDFSPRNHNYYGLNFTPFFPGPPDLVVIDPAKGTVVTLGQTVPNLHVLAFVKHN